MVTVVRISDCLSDGPGSIPGQDAFLLSSPSFPFYLPFCTLAPPLTLFLPFPFPYSHSYILQFVVPCNYLTLLSNKTNVRYGIRRRHDGHGRHGHVNRCHGHGHGRPPPRRLNDGNRSHGYGHRIKTNGSGNVRSGDGYDGRRNYDGRDDGWGGYGEGSDRIETCGGGNGRNGLLWWEYGGK